MIDNKLVHISKIHYKLIKLESYHMALIFIIKIILYLVNIIS
jgi:hypothetical protein